MQEEANVTEVGERNGAIVVASSLFLLGVAWPLNIPILLHILRTGELPVLPVGGIRLMGGGFIEAMGMKVMVASILLNGLTSALDVLAGYWLWKSDRRGGILGLALTPVFMIFAIGWLVPLMLVIGPLRAGLILRGWKELR